MRVDLDKFQDAFQRRLTLAFREKPPYSLEGVVREDLGEQYEANFLVGAKEADTPQQAIGEHNRVALFLLNDWLSGERKEYFVDLLLAKVLKDVGPCPNFF